MANSAERKEDGPFDAPEMHERIERMKQLTADDWVQVEEPCPSCSGKGAIGAQSIATCPCCRPIGLASCSLCGGTGRWSLPKLTESAERFMESGIR